MAIEHTPALMSYDAFMALPEGTRAELIDGVFTMTPSPSFHHQILCGRLFFALYGHVQAHKLGVVVGSPLDVSLRQQHPGVVVQPDVLFVSNAHRDRIQPSGLFGPPDLAVEVMSPSNARHDSVKKRQLYADYGVEEYWLVMPDHDQIEVMRREGTTFGRPQLYEPGDTLTTSLLPGFELTLAALFDPAP